jgi:nitric oxide reductase NorE protein
MTTLAATPAVDTDPLAYLPGDRDFWLFIIAELLMFGAFFIAYMLNRIGAVELFNTSQLALDRTLGVINTLFLVTSSWAVVLAVQAARKDRPGAVPRHLAVATTLGIVFVIVKCFEYAAKFEAGITMMTNTFYMFYFCLTLIHLLHVIAGSIILAVLWNKARHGDYHAHNTKGIEMGASYWHMVDLLWIFLFALLYLLR